MEYDIEKLYISKKGYIISQAYRSGLYYLILYYVYGNGIELNEDVWCICKWYLY